MSDTNMGEIILPLHCRVSGSADKTKVALTFQSQDREPLTFILPLANVVALQRHLAQTVFIMTAKPPAPGAEPGAEPAPSAA
jgi:hypothetical protein